MMIRIRAFAFAALLAASQAQAQSTWTFDRGATEVGFIGHRFGAVVTNGRFERYDGNFAIDFDHPERSRVRVTLETASIKAGSPLVDGFIAGESMLDVAHYPVASFVSEHVSRTGENSLDIRGRLTIKGVTQPFDVRATVDGDIERARRGEMLPFQASGSFLRPVYGIGRDVNVVDDRMEIVIRGRLKR
ncbi:YceI family protein [Bosea sp. TAF32]|uniref:YceI family protein n=1 Tax=Bosea sp. TAF32 TaxID=3237482 RepID=UPI003F903B94